MSSPIPQSPSTSATFTPQPDFLGVGNLGSDSYDVSGSSTPAASIHENDTIDGISDSQLKNTDHWNLQQKILKISEQIKIEQKLRDENVAEYLKLAENADKQQSQRIKTVFEKKNQKSKAIILQLQKKLDAYHKRLRDGEARPGTNSKQKYGLKDVSANFRDFSGGVVDSVKGGLSGFSQGTKTAAEAFVAKPKDIASKLKRQFGSADNIAGLHENGEEFQQFGSTDNISNATTNSADSMGVEETASPKFPHVKRIDAMLSAMQIRLVDLERKYHSDNNIQALLVAHGKIENEITDMQNTFAQQIEILTNSLQDERYRCETLEDQLNDFVELHHHEVADLRQEISSVEDKMEYLSQERARDMQEALEACRTRITKMELQQQQQHRLTMEGIEGATARTLLGKLFNLLMALLAVILVFVSTVTGLATPLLQSQTRLILSTVFLISATILYRKWDILLEYFSS